MPVENEIDTIRLTSTFDSYEPQSRTQKSALKYMQDLAAALAAAKERFNSVANPLKNGSFHVLSGAVGTGKTHLLEAFLNAVKAEASEVADKIVMRRCNFPVHSGAFDLSVFGEAPIIVLDDLFSTHQSVATLNKATDLPAIMRLISGAYDQKRMVIATTNFPFVEGIVPRMAEIDLVGRTLSRCKELLGARAGEICMEGPDFREVLMERAKKERKDNPGALPDVGL